MRFIIPFFSFRLDFRVERMLNFKQVKLIISDSRFNLNIDGTYS